MRLLTGLLAVGLVIGMCNHGDAISAQAFDTTSATSEAAAPADSAIDGASSPASDNAGTSSAATWRDVTIPAGTALPVVLDTSVGSDISRIEAPVRAHLSRAIVLGGRTVLASGSLLGGIVTDATRSGKVKGLAHVAVRFDTLTPRGDDGRVRIRTAAIGRTAPATKKKDAMTIGLPAAGGAVVGGLLGGNKGAAIGAAAGGGGGTAVVLSTRGKEVRLARGSRVTVRLTEPVTVRVPA